MPFTTGTATHHNDLLDDLKTWLEGTVGWTVLDYTAGAAATDVASLQLEGPGAGVGKRVYVNVQTENNVGSGFYSWQLYGATGYTASIPFGSQPGAGGGCYFNLWENSIDYWFYANDRRFIVEAKVSTNYMSMYGGFFLPAGTPTEYPFPLAIIGSYPTIERADVNNARNSMVVDPGRDAGFYRRRTTETWESLRNQENSGLPVSVPNGSARAFVWPHKTGRQTNSGDADSWGFAGLELLRLNANNEAPLIQAHIVDQIDGTFVGALEGCYSTTGFGRTTEQTITQGGRTFRLFQRAFRNTPGDFWAVEEV